MGWVRRGKAPHHQEVNQGADHRGDNAYHQGAV